MARTSPRPLVPSPIRDLRLGYFAALPPAVRRHLTQLRRIIREVAPGAVEAFSYGIPGFRLHGKAFLWYAGWKSHCSLYPLTDRIQREFRSALRPYARSKGTVRFPLDEPVPVSLVRRLVRARAREIGPGPRRPVRPAASGR